jgi:hypothetical protein
MSVSVRMEQSTTTKGPSARGLFSWMARAKSSLPVPVSPVMSVLASLLAAWAIRSRHLAILGLTPMMRSRFRATVGA